MKLAISIRLPSGSIVIHDGRELSDDGEGWAQACRRASMIGNKAIEFMESMDLVASKGWRMRKVAKGGLWTAWKDQSRSRFVMVRLIRD